MLKSDTNLPNMVLFNLVYECTIFRKNVIVNFASKVSSSF